MRLALKRAIVLAAVLTIGAGSWAECAGWQATPEARMACCVAGDACPMHPGEASGSGSVMSVSQAEADSCCAASDQDGSTPSSPMFVSNVFLEAAASPILFVVPSHAAFDFWRVLTPLPGTHVPKHLLISVFLI